MDSGVLGECSMRAPKPVVEGRDHATDCAIPPLHLTEEKIALAVKLVWNNVTNSHVQVKVFKSIIIYKR